MEYAALVVADDLTGAMDTGNEFARRGHATTAALGREVTDPDARVAVVNTESRYLSRAEAGAVVRSVVDAHPAPVVYKKVDSTLRGNLAAEIDAAVNAVGADLAVVAPAFPANGRTTEDGVHRVDGTPVDETPAGNDPDKPVSTAHLPTLLAAGSHPVAQLPVSTTDDGAPAVADALTALVERRKPTVVACDATTDRHLATIARGAAKSGLTVVYVGSAGLARHVAVPATSPEQAPRSGCLHRDDPAGSVRCDTEEPCVLGIAGSTNPVTVEQVRAVPAHRRVTLDLRESVAAPSKAVADATTRCLARFDDHEAVLLTTVGDDASAGIRAGRECGLTETEVRARISRTLGSVTRRITDDRRVTGYFLTGGAVAVDVLNALGTDGIRLSGDAVESGVPIGSLVGGTAAGTRVVTKAGAFGQRGTIHNSLATLRQNDE